MSDNRTPTQLGQISARRVLGGFPEQASPDFFFKTASYETFLTGRKFNADQQKEFERAYRAEYRDATKTV